MPSNSQSQLDAFTTTEESTPDRSASTPAAASTTDKSDTTQSTVETPLDDFYEVVRASFEETSPSALLDVDQVMALTPDRDVFSTSDLPDGLEVTPTRVGQWELDYHDDTTVTYRASGRVFDERWGEGGSIVRHRVYLNDSGANRDGMWHYMTELVTGYGNPSQVRKADTSDKARLSGIRGHSVQNNDGDYGVSGGTNARFEDIKTAVATVVAQLHTEPSTIRTHLPDTDEQEWTLTKYGLRTATYERLAPNETDYDYLRLTATQDRVYLKGAKENEPSAHHDRVPVPIPDSIPPACATQTERATTVVASSLSPLLIEPILKQPVEEVLEAIALPQ
ncbi:MULTISPECIES: hypothetical protein [Haloarculaceae]|uniref:hypothetical protein n=1 Tax=Halobacteriales TaxID=2235 RepID=UPI0020C9B4E1|nr:MULTISPECIES: hypothetical protein [Haloarculaceae]MDT3436751.1 hypothetical protein [Haloarcula sp. 1CSR25-25]